MKTFIARVRSFRSPRVTLLLLLAGLSVEAIARLGVAAGGPSRAASIASLDSAIAAAVPSTEADTAEASVERLRTLVSQKRDVQVDAQRAVERWFYCSIGGAGLMLAAIVTGSIAFVDHLRGDASHGDVSVG